MPRKRNATVLNPILLTILIPILSKAILTSEPLLRISKDIRRLTETPMWSI